MLRPAKQIANTGKLNRSERVSFIWAIYPRESGAAMPRRIKSQLDKNAGTALLLGAGYCAKAMVAPLL